MSSPSDAGLQPRDALRRLVAPVRQRLTVAIIWSALSAPCATLAAIGVVELCRGLVDDRPSTTWCWAAVAAAAALAQVLFYSAALRASHRADAEFRFTIRRRIARHLARVELGWFQSGSGEVKQALADDVKHMHVLIAHLTIDVVPMILTPILGAIYLLVIDWRFALIFIGYLAISVLTVLPAFLRDYQQSAGAYAEAMAALTKATVELGDGIEVAKTYPAASGLADRYARAVDDLVGVCLAWMTRVSRPMAIVGILFSPAVLIAVVIVIGSILVNAAIITPITVFAFLVVGVGLPVSALHVGSIRGVIRAGEFGAAHILQVLRTRELPVPDNPRQMRSRRIEFDHVTFGYDAMSPVISDVSFTVEPGTFTAIVGASGSGKTTLARLIARFWDVNKGVIRIGDVDVRDQSTAELLGSMALVFQDVTVLRDTVRENIRLGRAWITDEQIVAAAQQAQIHDVITALPEGYDTVLEAGDSSLSGGEQQRLTIARALVAEPGLVILDEATAHVDPHNELLIQRALAALAARGATLVVIAHRLRTIAHADQILVLDEGRVAERGTHAELIAYDGHYQRLWLSAATGDQQ